MKKFVSFVVAAVTAAGLFAVPVPAFAAAPDSVATAEAKLDELNNQVEQSNARLDAANRHLATDQKLEADLNVQIAAVARLQYKRPSLIVQFLEANSLSQVLGDISSNRLMASKERSLLLQARDLRRQDQQARDEATLSAASIKTSRDQAKVTADEAVAERDAAIRARALAIGQATPATSTPAPYVGGGPYPNRFSYGYCTWYVANRRYIPWLGNAIDWWPNARAYGYSEGQVPQVGAVMGTRESGYGHVANVEAGNAH